MVDPDSWLQAIDGKAYVRRVGSDGCVDGSLEAYYIGKQWSGRYVTVHVERNARLLRDWHGTSQIKELPIKKLVGRLLPLQAFLDLMQEAALADARRGTCHTTGITPTIPVVGKNIHGEENKPLFAVDELSTEERVCLCADVGSVFSS